MREIKFRAWFAKERKMVDVKRIDFFGGRLGKTHATIHAETDFEKGGWFSKLKESTNRNTSLPNSNEQIKRVDLMQYTGLKDSKGNEIYEGDVVKFLYKPSYPLGDSEFDEVVICRVAVCLTGEFILEKSCSDEFEESLFSAVNYDSDLEVIGNIHDNPELLEGDNA